MIQVAPGQQPPPATLQVWRTPEEGSSEMLLPDAEGYRFLVLRFPGHRFSAATDVARSAGGGRADRRLTLPLGQAGR